MWWFSCILIASLNFPRFLKENTSCPRGVLQQRYGGSSLYLASFPKRGASRHEILLYNHSQTAMLSISSLYFSFFLQVRVKFLGLFGTGNLTTRYITNWTTPWIWVLLAKQIVIKILRNYPTFMILNGLLLCSLEPATSPNPESVWSSPRPHKIFHYTHFNIAYCFCLCRPSVSFLTGFTIKMCAFGICPPNIILRDIFPKRILKGTNYLARIFFRFMLLCIRSTLRYRSWLRHYATSRKVTGSIPNEVIGSFDWPNPSSLHHGPGVDSASNRNEYQESFRG
jgi:hypothetical protein